MKKLMIMPVLLATLLLASCGGENAENKEVKQENKEKFNETNVEDDAAFAVKAASGGMMEVELGNLAMTNGESQAVKDFGKNMVTDHTAANNELKAMAAGKNISLPTTPSADMQKKIDDLKKKTGHDFDKDYVDLMVSDHKDDIDLFQKEAEKGGDADVKAWAAGKVPILQHHLQMVQDIKATMK